MNFHFASPAFLLLLIPLVGWTVWLARRNGHNAHVSFSGLEQFPQEILRVYSLLYRALGSVRFFGFVILILALARPQVPDREVLTGEGVDVMVALDMSASMNAVDMEQTALEEALGRGETPQNRFEVARKILGQFVENRQEDRVGLVIFGEHAYLKFPLTLDYSRVLALIAGLRLDNGERDPGTGQCTNQCTISGGGPPSAML